MRFLHLKVEEFEMLANPHNSDVITIAPRAVLINPQFVTQRWGVVGLRFGHWPGAETPHLFRNG